MIHVGLIGLGFMAVAHIRAYRQLEGVRITAVCNPSGRNLDGDLSKVSGNVGSQDPVRLDMTEIKACRNPSDLFLDSSIDVIDICTPTATHPELAIAALASGKHVLCEKPLARTSALAREVVAAARAAKGMFMPAMCLRFWPEWAWLKRAIDEKTYGRILGLHLRRIAEPPGWGQSVYLNGAASGGALLDLHIHDTDFVQFCFGRPHSVFSSGFSKVSGAIDHVVTIYSVASGTTVSAEGSWAMDAGFGFNMAYRAVFERATADYDIARSAEALRVFEPNHPPRTVSCEGPDGYVRELQHFIESIRSGTPPIIVTGADGLSAVEICEAEERSIQIGQPVEL